MFLSTVKKILQKLFVPETIRARDLARMSPLWYRTLVLLFSLATVLVINQIFSLRIFGFLPIATAYTYYILAAFLSSTFIVYPASNNCLDRIPWYDIVLFVTAIAVNCYFAANAIEIIQFGWELIAPPLPTALSFVLWFLVVEAARRTSGLLLALICAIFSFYPIYTDYLPGILDGASFTLLETARNHAMSTDAILGVAISSLGTLLIGFLLFGVVLSRSGGGDFFLQIAQGLFGNKPGGPAKVSVVSSALFGSISGSAVANVVSTGTITIPLMKRTGFSPEYAAAVEACASTGGVIAPPVMGAAAFLMASFLGVSYSDVVTAAVIPAILFYLGIFFQIDFFSQKYGLKGMPSEEIPSVKEALKKGWFYLSSIVVLIYFLFVVRIDAWAPFYASLMLLVVTMLSRSSRLSMRDFVEMMYEFGLTVGRITALLACVGLIIGPLSRTGVALSFSRELVVVSKNVLTLLVTGAITSFILGMGMVSVAVYIFLAIVMVPALVKFGIEPIAAHFYVLYWGVVSFITPPVALATYTAAGLANADPLKTGLVAVRLGTMFYVLPFMFVYNPALLAQGDTLTILVTFIIAVFGVYFIAAGYEGYLTRVGPLPIVARVCLTIGGILVAFPEMISTIVGFLLIIATVAVQVVRNRALQKAPARVDA